MDNSFGTSFLASRAISRSTTDEGSLFAHKGGGKQATDGMSSLGSWTKYNMSSWVLILQVGMSHS